MEPSVSEVLAFLYRCYERGVQYKTLQVKASALSFHLMPLEGLSVGKHPVIREFLDAAFQNRASTSPRTYPSWEVSTVLDYLRTIPLEADLSLFAKKTAMLVALSLAGRCQTLHLLSLRPDLCIIAPSHIQFKLRSPPKGSRRSNLVHEKSYIIGQFQDELVDPYRHIIQYIDRTRILRESDQSLFVNINIPHKSASTVTLSAWLRYILTNAVKNCTDGPCTAHSIRAVATSTAYARGVALSTVLDAATWSGSHTFFSHYRVPMYPHQELQAAVFASPAPAGSASPEL
jgi:hypothetical protein